MSYQKLMLNNEKLLNDLETLLADDEETPRKEAASPESLEKAVDQWREEITASENEVARTSRAKKIVNFFFRSRNARVLGGKEYGKILQAYASGGEDAAEALFSRAMGDRTLLADACSQLSRKLSETDKQKSALYAYRAWKYDPRPFRLKWHAFRLYAAGDNLNSLALLSLIKDSVSFSDSEFRVYRSLLEKYEQERGKSSSDAQLRTIGVGAIPFAKVELEVDLTVPQGGAAKYVLARTAFNRAIAAELTAAYGLWENDPGRDSVRLGLAILPRVAAEDNTYAFLLKKPDGPHKIILEFRPNKADGKLDIARADIEFLDALPGMSAYPAPIDEFWGVWEANENTEYKFDFNIRDVDNPAAGVTITFYDANFNRLLPLGSLSINPYDGNYRYLTYRGVDRAQFQITMEKNVRYMLILGKKWSASGSCWISEPPRIEAGQDALAEFNQAKEIVAAIPPETKCLIVYASTASVGYEKPIKLRSARMAQYFASKGIFTLYGTFNAPGRMILDDNFIQAGPANKFELINLLLKRKGPNNCLYVTSFADVNSIGVFNRARNMGWKTVFELRDDMEEMWSLGISKWYNPLLEKYVAARADYRAAVSRRLKNRLEAMSAGAPTILNPNGVSKELIEKCAPLRTVAVAKKRASDRLIGYIGSLNPNFFDWALLRNFALRYPSVSIEIIGNDLPESIELPENIKYLGAIYHDDSLEIVSRWSAGLIPFIASRLTWAVSPNKAYEYLAMGLRVITAPMGRTDELPITAIYKTLDEFAKAVFNSFEPVSAKEYEEVDRFLKENSWQKRFNDLSDSIGF